MSNLPISVTRPSRVLLVQIVVSVLYALFVVVVVVDDDDVVYPSYTMVVRMRIS